MRIEMNRRALWALFLVGVGMAILAGPASVRPADPSEVGTMMLLALWFIVGTVAAMAPIPLPRTGSFVRLTAATDLAVLLVFGPLIAPMLGVLSRVVARIGRREERPWRTVEDAGIALLALSAAGTVYVAFGGRSGSALFLTPHPLLAVIAAGIVYGVVGAAGESIAGALARRTDAGAAWWTAFVGRVPYDLAMLPFGLLLAQTQIQVGSLGTAVFLLPLLFARQAMHLWSRAKEVHVDAVRTLMTALDATDAFTRGHSTRIATLSVRVARRLGLNDREVEQIEYAALLHDFGRTALRHNVLNKPGRLDAEEQNEIRLHPRIGSDFIRRMPYFVPAADIVLAHHERPDGAGYPLGIAGDRIPIGSRIIMAVAAYDAMTTDRPYRPGLPPEAAFEELLAHCGSQFSPEVVEVLVELYAEGRMTEPTLDGAASESAAGTGGAMVPFAPGRTLCVAARSDAGLVRENNEDRYGVIALEAPSPRALLVVADGMGGAAAGEIASGLAVERVEATCRAAPPSCTVPNLLRAALCDANDAVRRAALADSTRDGMGTTCTAALIDEHGLWLGHVGDTRACLVTRDGVAVLTRDHTLGAEMKRAVAGGGEVPDVSRHILTRCVGAEVEIDPDISDGAVTVQAGDVLVLCSDGLAGLVDLDEMHRVVLDAHPDEAADRLVALARERGGPDNITVIVARVDEVPRRRGKRR